jgi:hypothetical protein
VLSIRLPHSFCSNRCNSNAVLCEHGEHAPSFTSCKAFTASCLRIQLLWDMMLAHWLIGSRRFEGTWHIYFQGPTVPRKELRSHRREPITYWRSGISQNTESSFSILLSHSYLLDPNILHSALFNIHTKQHKQLTFCILSFCIRVCYFDSLSRETRRNQLMWNLILSLGVSLSTCWSKTTIACMLLFGQVAQHACQRSCRCKTAWALDHGGQGKTEVFNAIELYRTKIIYCSRIIPLLYIY